MIVMAAACNRCRKIVGPFAMNKHAARVAAHLEGWKVYGRSGGQQDICPDCAKSKRGKTLIIDSSGLEFAKQDGDATDATDTPDGVASDDVADEDEKEKQGAQTADPAP